MFKTFISNLIIKSLLFYKIFFILLSFCLIFNSFSNTTKNKEVYFFKGTIGEYEIKAKLIIINNENSVSWWHAIKGYYYYRNNRKKIKLNGEFNAGNGSFWLEHKYSNSESELFEGNLTDYWEDITGIWKKGDIQLDFHLKRI